jgi:hypothetical protein
MPGWPRVPTQEPPRVVVPLPPTPARSIVSSPSWSPPPCPAGSTFLSPTPVQAPFQATPQRLTLPAPLLQGWGLHLKCHGLALRCISLHENSLPIAPAPGCRHRPLLRYLPLEDLSTSVSPTRCPRPKPLSPLQSHSALQASAGPCQPQRYRDLPVSAKH